LDNPDKDGMKILKWVLDKHSVKVWTGFKWPRIESSGGLLWAQ